MQFIRRNRDIIQAQTSKSKVPQQTNIDLRHSTNGQHHRRQTMDWEQLQTQKHQNSQKLVFETERDSFNPKSRQTIFIDPKRKKKNQIESYKTESVSTASVIRDKSPQIIQSVKQSNNLQPVVAIISAQQQEEPTLVIQMFSTLMNNTQIESSVDGNDRTLTESRQAYIQKYTTLGNLQN